MRGAMWTRRGSCVRSQAIGALAGGWGVGGRELGTWGGEDGDWKRAVKVGKPGSL